MTAEPSVPFSSAAPDPFAEAIRKLRFAAEGRGIVTSVSISREQAQVLLDALTILATPRPNAEIPDSDSPAAGGGPIQDPVRGA